MYSTKTHTYELIPTVASLESYGYMAHAKRKRLSHEITVLLNGGQQRLFILFNFLLVSIDRLVDRQIQPPDFLLGLGNLMQKAWRGESVEPVDEYEHVALEFIQVLRALKHTAPIPCTHIYADMQCHLRNDYANAQRRGKVLSGATLHDIGEGACVYFLAAWFHIVSFALQRDDVWCVAQRYSRPGRMADDLVDVAEDISAGYINVSKENLEHLDTDHAQLSQQYIVARLQAIQNDIQEADAILEATMRKVPNNDRARLQLLRDLIYSWVEDAERISIGNGLIATDGRLT